MFEPKRGGVRRPFLYFVAALVAGAAALPLAVASGQVQTAGLFDECYGSHCSGVTLIAEAE